MTPDERQMLADLFERIRSTANSPRDPQAEAFINDAIRAQPYAAYALAQTVLVQQHALEEAAKRISDLEAHPQPAQETSFLGNIGRSLFGSSAPAPQPQARAYDSSAYQRSPGPAPGPGYAPPPPQGYPQQGYPQQGYAPQSAGPWGAPGAPAGGGFMSSALRTATGVAGGLLVGNALENMLGGRGGMFGGGGGMFGGGMAGMEPRETINNFYENAPDPAGQQAQDTLQDMDQDQDDAQDAGDYGYDNGGSDDSI